MKTNQGKTRIIKPENVLSQLVTYGETFRVGLLFDANLLARVDLKRFGLINSYTEGQAQMPQAAGVRTKTNLKGMYVRKQPEEKEEIKRRIEYTRKKDRTKIRYDRVFLIFKKVLLDNLRIELTFKTSEDGTPFITSPPLIFDDDYANGKKIAHVINLFLEIFGDYEILRENLEYYVKAEIAFENEILPSGILSDPRTFSELVEKIEQFVNEVDRKPLVERLSVFKEFGPIIRRSRGGSGYIALIFEEKGIVAAESIKRNNATYFFRIQDYEDTILKDKQEVIKNKLMIKRLFHSDEWEKHVRRFLNLH